jgi:hypothetical protein
MTKILDWLDVKVKIPTNNYNKKRKEFEDIIGRTITITIDLPEGLDEYREDFLTLEKDEKFIEIIKNVIKERLTKKNKLNEK